MSHTDTKNTFLTPIFLLMEKKNSITRNTTFFCCSKQQIHSCAPRHLPHRHGTHDPISCTFFFIRCTQQDRSKLPRAHPGGVHAQNTQGVLRGTCAFASPTSHPGGAFSHWGGICRRNFVTRLHFLWQNCKNHAGLLRLFPHFDVSLHRIVARVAGE